MKKYRFYFKSEKGESFPVYINAESFEKAVDIAFEKEAEVDIDMTILSFLQS